MLLFARLVFLHFINMSFSRLSLVVFFSDKLYMFYDDWTEYVWQNFSRQGYVTMFAEDRPDIGNFNYKGMSSAFALAVSLWLNTKLRRDWAKYGRLACDNWRLGLPY